MLLIDYIKMECYIEQYTKRQLTKIFADHEMPLERYVKAL